MTKTIWTGHLKAYIVTYNNELTRYCNCTQNERKWCSNKPLFRVVYVHFNAFGGPLSFSLTSSRNGEKQKNKTNQKKILLFTCTFISVLWHL